MTTDDILRAAVQCQLITTGNRDGLYAAALVRFATLIRAVALAEQPAEQEPVAWRGYTITNGYTLHFHYGEAHRVASKIEPLYTAPSPAIPPGYKLVPVEPTSEMSDAGGSAVRVCYSKQYGDRREGEMMCDYIYRKMLSAAPEAPQPAKREREPLTDEEINEAYGDARVKWGHIPHDDVARIARAIERAHGIGEQE